MFKNIHVGHNSQVTNVANYYFRDFIMHFDINLVLCLFEKKPDILKTNIKESSVSFYKIIQKMVTEFFSEQKFSNH